MGLAISMAQKINEMATKIQWAEETWNPVVGCSKVSPGCNNCYAERMAKRLCAMGQENYFPVVNPGGWTGKTHLVESALSKPLHWKKPRTIFVCSMGDLFHESISFNDILEVMYIIHRCPQHTFLFLTKRPQRMHEFFTDWIPNPFWIHIDNMQNVWLGVTAENQEQADKRIPILLQIPAAKRFVSIEPMLGPIDLKTEWIEDELQAFGGNGANYFNSLGWVICGAESGPNRRDMSLCWVDSLKDQCVNAGVSFFFKQMYQGNKKIKMPELDGQIWNQTP